MKQPEPILICPFTDRCKAHVLTLVEGCPAIRVSVERHTRCNEHVPDRCIVKQQYDQEVRRADP